MASRMGVLTTTQTFFYKVAIFTEMIKFEHTVFALPFAYLGALLAAGGLPGGREVLWITVAMVAARTAAMSLNRLVDRAIDALNPRTVMRALPQGLLKPAEVWVAVISSFIVLFVAAVMLNQLCVRLLPVAVAVLVLYSYTKRWTWLCHWVLGVADGLAPLGAWVAIRGTVEWPGIFLMAAVAIWVAGFDLVYACQDCEFDRRHGLHSLPARFGLSTALSVAGLTHLAVPILLIAAGELSGTGFVYYLGVAVATWLLIYQHRLISPRDLTRLNFASLNVNAYLSVLMLSFTLVDRLLGG